MNIRYLLLFGALLSFCATPSFGQSTKPLSAVSNLWTGLTARIPVPGETVYVAGYTNIGDGFEGIFVHRSGSLDTNAAGYGWIYKPAASTGYYERMDKDPVTPQMFGAFGSVGVPTIDETTQFRNMLEFARSTNGSRRVYLGSRNYLTKSLNVEGLEVWGKLQSLAPTDPRNGTVIFKVPSDSDHHLKIVTTNSVQESSATYLHDFQLFGAKNTNLYFPKAITAVVTTNRFAFFVATNDLPAEPTSGVDYWPYYGPCFFYSDDPYYVGHGMVRSVNRTTGEVTLLDWYGTPYATTAGALSVGWKVSFSPEVTEAGRLIGELTGVSGADAGYSGIWISGTTTNALQQSIRLERLSIRNYHTGIREGAVIHTKVKDVFTLGNAWAGWSQPFPFCSRDAFFGGESYFSGIASADLGQTVPTDLIDDEYCRSAWGVYLPSAAGFGSQVTADGPVNGFYFDRPANSIYGVMRVDGAIGSPFVFGGTSQGAGPSKSDVAFLALSSISPNVYPETNRTPRSFILSVPRTNYYNNISVGMLHAEDFGNSQGWWSSLFDLREPLDSIKIGIVASAEGYTNQYADGSARVMWDTMGVTNAALAGSRWWQLPYSTSIELAISGQDRGTLGGGTFQGVFNILDFGSDYTTGTNRTDNTKKGIMLEMPSYDTDAPLLGLIGGVSDNGSDKVILGSIGSTNTATATSIEGYTTATQGGEPNLTYQLGHSLFQSTAGLSLSNSAPQLSLVETDSDALNRSFILRYSGNVGLIGFGNSNQASINNAIAIFPEATGTKASFISLATTTNGITIGNDSPGNTNRLGIKALKDGVAGGEWERDPTTGFIGIAPLTIPNIGGDTNFVFLADNTSVNDPNLLSTGADIKWSISGSTNILGNVGTNTITSAKIVDATITTNDLDAAVNALLITAGTSVLVENTSVNDPNFTGTGADISPSVGASTNVLLTIKTNTVTSAKIVDGTIAVDDVADGTLTGAKLTTNTIPLDAIVDVTEQRFIGRGEGSGNGPSQELETQGSDYITNYWDGPAFGFRLLTNDIPLLSRANVFTGDTNTFRTIVATNFGIDEMSVTDLDVSGDFTANGTNLLDLIFGASQSAGSKTIARFLPVDFNPGTNLVSYPFLENRGDGHWQLMFDGTVGMCATADGEIPEGAILSSGITVAISEVSTATSGTNVFSVEFERLTSQDIDSNGFATATNIVMTPSGTSGTPTKGTVTSTFLDSLAAEEAFRLRVCRLPGDASDTFTNHVGVIRVNLKTAN